MPRKPKLTAEERSRINRANASKSTGPRTPEGKAKSRLNACRHGLTGQFITIQSQDLAAYVRHGRELVLGFNPIGPEEVTLTQYLIDAAWLMHHANTLEINARPMAAVSIEWLGRHRYRIERGYYKARAELRAVQKERFALELKAEEAKENG